MLSTDSITAPTKRTKQTHDEAACQEFGKRLAAAIEKKGLSQADIGRRMGISRSAVNWWTSGNTYPSIDNVKELAKLLDTTPEWLLFGLHSVSSTSKNVHIPIQDRESDAFITLPLDFIVRTRSGSYDNLRAFKVVGSYGTQIAIVNADDTDISDTPRMMVMKNKSGKGGDVVKVSKSPNKTEAVMIEHDQNLKEMRYRPDMFVGHLAAMVELGSQM